MNSTFYQPNKKPHPIAEFLCVVGIFAFVFGGIIAIGA